MIFWAKKGQIMVDLSESIPMVVVMLVVDG
jgi:hypothetical protein